MILRCSLVIKDSENSVKVLDPETRLPSHYLIVLDAIKRRMSSGFHIVCLLQVLYTFPYAYNAVFETLAFWQSFESFRYGNHDF